MMFPGHRAGVFAEFWAIPNTLRTRIELRHGMGSGNGFVADAAADYLLHFGQATFALGPRLGLGDQDFMRRQYRRDADRRSPERLGHPLQAGRGAAIRRRRDLGDL